MKSIILPLLFFCLFACTNKEKSLPRPFTTDMLASQLYSIDPGKDTSIKTLHGSIIKITAGSFNVSGTIQLEIKEALSPMEMFAAGLSTESNGRLLKSGGMIYVNGTSNGEQVGIIKPIKISIPNQYYDSAMQVFKGVETDSGNINWIDPKPVDTTEQSKNWENGKLLFSKCASCHAIFSDGTGPALKDVENRGPWTDRKNILSFVNNPGRFISQNKYAQNLKRKFGSVMTGFPDHTKESIDAILDYIKNESKRPGAREDERKYRDSISKVVYPVDTSYVDSVDYLGPEPAATVNIKPCKDDTVYLPLPSSDQTFFEQTGTGSLPAVTAADTPPEPAPAESMEGLRRGFTDPNPTSGMYDFEIRTFGWYNVDAYVEGYAGSTNVKLWVQLQVEFDISMHVYLFCPRNKMLSVMNDKRNGKFYFKKINDGIPLFLTDRAILFAFGSKGQKIYYGIKEFSIQGEQTIEIRVTETTPEEIKRKLHSKNMDGIDLGMEQKEMKVISNPCNEIQAPAESANK